MKEILTLAIISLLLLSTFSILAPQVKAESPVNSNEAPADHQPEEVAPLLNGSEVLLIKDVEPWFTWVHGAIPEAVLDMLGKTYGRINSWQLADWDLSEYRIVMIASDQYPSTYSNLISSKGKLATYVYNGGTLIAHACDYGWNSYPPYPSPWLPGDVWRVHTFPNDLTDNHLRESQTYGIKIEFTSDVAQTILWTIKQVGGRGWNTTVIWKDTPLRDLLIEYGEYTITLSLWDVVFAEKYDEVVFPSIEYAPGLMFYLDSPADLYVTDPLGRHAGVEPDTGLAINQIPGATYTGPGSEPQVISIPNPLDGNYVVLLIGTATGTYSLTTELILPEETVTQTYTGETVEGAIYVYSVTLGDGVMTVDPDPIAELEHLKEFIDGLPGDSFDKPKLASQRKNALFNKIDEVILKVEAGNYTDAVNKLFHDIRAKMDGDSTAQDWIIDPTAQFSLCIIIDHIISNIEILQEKSG
jgi:hypothetical protein